MKPQVRLETGAQDMFRSRLDQLQDVFRQPLHLASRVLDQKQNQRGKKSLPSTGSRVYSLHAPEVECIGNGKAHAPYEFGVKVVIATTLNRSKGGQFALHAKALPGNPYDGHTLAEIIPDMERTIGHIKNEHRMGRNYLAHKQGDAINAVLATAGYNFRLLLTWLRLPLRLLLAMFFGAIRPLHA